MLHSSPIARLAALAIATLTLSISGCKSGTTDSGTDTITTVTVSGYSQPIAVGATLRLSAAAATASGTAVTASFTWSASPTTVASVSSDGTVTGVSAGTATITASSGGVNGTVVVAINNATPVATTVSPASAQVGSGAQTLTVIGTGFAAGATVRWNGTDLVTTFVSTTHLAAALPASNLVTAGSASVTVFNPAPGGGASTAIPFTISTGTSNPVPAITSTTPGTATAGGAAFTLTVTGTGFTATSVVRWNGVARTTTFVSATQLTAQISAADIALAGNASITVFNALPGGGTSSAQTFAVTGTASLISAGSDHVCAIGASGKLYCWGSNILGQLGDNQAESYSAVPVPVAGVGGLTFVDVSANYGYSCAVATTGAAYCWGTMGYAGGSFGLASGVSQSNTPLLISGALHFTSISTALNMICGVVTDGSGYCWGAASSGQLGNGTNNASNAPVLVSGGLHFSRIAASSGHECGLTTSGAAFCWGSNNNGELGNGTTAASTVPVAVSGGLTFKTVVANGGSVCGITTIGAGYCWGSDSQGALGNGSIGYTTSLTPQPILGGLSLASIAANDGSIFVCGVTTAGAAYCWGYEMNGELGNGSVAVPNGTPTAVAGGYTFAQVTVGDTHACGITTNSVAVCWGAKYQGVLGNGTLGIRVTPTPIASPLTFTAVATGGQFGCALAATTKAAWCWGSNGEGELGNGSLVQATSPTAVIGGLQFASLTAGSAFACGLTSAGAAYCWGYNNQGQLGNGNTTNQSAPVAVSGGLTFQSIVAAGEATCGISAGATYCWGSGSTRGTTTASSVPVVVPGGLTFTTVTVGEEVACGLTAAGSAFCWGTSFGGEFGNGIQSSTGVPTPVAVAAGHSFTALSAGDRIVCGIANDNFTYCWGAHFGNGSLFVPTAVSGTVGFTALRANYHACGLSAAGVLSCWGINEFGELGNGGISATTASPSPVTGGLTFSAFSMGLELTCGLVSGANAGQVRCWGSNEYGMLGIGDDPFVTQPTPVSTGVLLIRATALRAGPR